MSSEPIDLTSEDSSVTVQQTTTIEKQNDAPLTTGSTTAATATKKRERTCGDEVSKDDEDDEGSNRTPPASPLEPLGLITINADALGAHGFVSAGELDLHDFDVEQVVYAHKKGLDTKMTLIADLSSIYPELVPGFKFDTLTVFQHSHITIENGDDAYKFKLAGYNIRKLPAEEEAKDKSRL